MRRFHDPYSRHIPETVMMLRQRGIRGETVGIGVMLKRSWHFNELPRAIRGLFMAPANNFTCGGRSSTQLPYQSSEKGSRGNVFSNLFNRLKGENTKLNSLAHTIGRRKVWTCYSFFQHLTVTFQTAAPFFLAAACHHFSDLDILKKAPGNTRVVKVISISIGVMQIIKKLTSIICPIEVASLQSGGPSVSSGVEIGDQVYFVDGRAVNTLSLKKVNELLSEGEVGDTVHVGIVRARRNLQAPSTSSSPATSNTVNGDYSSRGTISHTNSNSNEYSTHNSQRNFQDRSSKVSDLPGSEGKEFISFEIIRDNVFASRVSSCILSYPSYSDPRSAAKTVAKEFDLEEDLVASAGILNRSHSESETGGIGYISIGEFTQRTLLEVENALDTIKKQLYLAAQKRKRQRPTTFTRNLKGENRVSSALSEEESEGASSYLLDGLIIDLRGNLGGTLPSALDAASLFLPQGNVLLQMKTMASPAALSANDIVRNENGNGNGNSGSGSQVSRRGTASFLKGVPFLGVLTKSLRKTNDRIERYYSTSKDSDVSTPLLLLVDSHTASASEIFAAALIDNNRATCMGSKTLGKNVAQVVEEHSFSLSDMKYSFPLVHHLLIYY